MKFDSHDVGRDKFAGVAMLTKSDMLFGSTGNYTRGLPSSSNGTLYSK